MPTAIGRFIPPVADWASAEAKTEHEWIEGIAEPELKKLRGRGLSASLAIVEGDPKHIITQTAESWHADSIFVGANAYGSRVERYILGSTSAAIAARANCTVEVVRRHPPSSID
jgi:nucleotide-binding universal stress UspA family protein